MANPDMLTVREAPIVPLASWVKISADRLWVTLNCGRLLGVPLTWLPALVLATPQQRDNHQILDDGAVLFWPDLDEYVAVKRLLYPGCAHGEDKNVPKINPTGD